MRRKAFQLPAHVVVALATLMVAGYFLLALVQRTLHIYQLKVEETRLTREVADLRTRYHQLVAQRDGLMRDTDIEKVAREELNLIKEGETAVVVIPSQQAIAEAQRSPTARRSPPPSKASKQPVSPGTQILQWFFGR